MNDELWVLTSFNGNVYGAYDDQDVAWSVYYEISGLNTPQRVEPLYTKKGGVPWC